MRNAAKAQIPPPEQAPSNADAKIIVAIAGLIALKAGVDATAAKVATLIGLPVAAVLPALRLAMLRSMSYGVTALPSANATQEAQALEPTYRAAFVLASSRRLAAAAKRGVPRRDSLAQERRFFDLHMEATRRRRSSAAEVDRLAQQYGPELGWYAKMDSRTSEECRQANGKNFTATRIPEIGFPGAVHPSCRCKPGKPFSTSKSVYGIKRSA